MLPIAPQIHPGHLGETKRPIPAKDLKYAKVKGNRYRES